MRLLIFFNKSQNLQMNNMRALAVQMSFANMTVDKLLKAALYSSHSKGNYA